MEKKSLSDMNKENEKNCKTCIHYKIIMDVKAVCDYWCVGFDMRCGLKPCEEYKCINK